MKLHFYGADRCVTGSCHCLEINGKKILVDCGLQQGRDELDNRYLAFAPGNIDILLVTHAHIDHTGRIPLLVKNGFHGRILTTRLTADLMKIMLLDSAHIQESDAEYENRKGERAGREHVDPLYTEQDALDVFKYVTTCEYKEKVDLCEGVSAVRGMLRQVDRLCKENVESAAFVVHGGTIMAVLEQLAEDQKDFYHWQVENGGGYRMLVNEDEWKSGIHRFREIQKLGGVTE